MPSGNILIDFKLRLDKSLDLDGLVKASKITSLSDRDFNDRESLSPQALI